MTKEIYSLQHPFVKHLVKLRENKSYRYAERRVIVAGIKLIKEMSSNHKWLTLLHERDAAVPFAYAAEKTIAISPQVLKKITGLENPEPIAAELLMPAASDLLDAQFLLVLDHISDPGNLGTLLRTAKAFNWCGAFLMNNCVDPYNEKALRAAKGATFALPWKQGSWDELRELLAEKKIPLWAADCKGADFTQNSLPSSLALALGNEAHGLSEEIKKVAQIIGIPLLGDMESLNVASAGAILMHGLRG